MPKRGNRVSSQKVPNNDRPTPDGATSVAAVESKPTPVTPPPAPAPSSPTPKEANTELRRVPASEIEFLAVTLHQAREDKNMLRQQLVAKERKVIELQAQVSALVQRIIQLEMIADEKENADLRKEHDFKLGRTIHRDDSTGEIYWEISASDQ